MKPKLLKIIVSISIVSLLSSCGKNMQSAQSEDTLDRIRQTGQIDACTVVEPPYIVKDSITGALSGPYIDALDIIAQKMNAKVLWHETTFGNATADLSSKRCDIVDAVIYAIIPRAMAIQFTDPPLAYQGLSAIILKKNPRFGRVKDIFDFDKPDVTVAIATGTAPDSWLQQNFHKATIKRIDVEPSNLIRHLMEVSANRADIAIYPTEECDRYAHEHPEVKVIFRNPPISLYPVCWAVRQDDVKWLHFLETALQFLDTQGTMAQLEKKYNAHLLHLVKQYKLQ